MNYSYDQLNAKETKALEEIKINELERIASNEQYRQSLISSILTLQNIETNVDFRKTTKG